MARTRVGPRPVWPVGRCNDHIIVVVVITVIPRIVNTDAVIDSCGPASAVRTFAAGECAQRKQKRSRESERSAARFHINGPLSASLPATQGFRQLLRLDPRSPPLCR